MRLRLGLRLGLRLRLRLRLRLGLRLGLRLRLRLGLGLGLGLRLRLMPVCLSVSCLSRSFSNKLPGLQRQRSAFAHATASVVSDPPTDLAALGH